MASASEKFSIEHSVQAVIRACEQNTLEAYDHAQSALRDELAKPDLCSVHALKLQQLCEVTVGHQQAFTAFVKEFECGLRTHLFFGNVENAVRDGELLAQMMALKFPQAAGESPSLAIRVAAAAQRGDMMAKLMVAQYSRTDEELEEIGQMMIPVQIVRDGDQ
jgi:hypothetical protein